MRQSPVVEIIAVLCWLQLLSLIWYAIETERNLIGYIIATAVAAVIMLSLVYQSRR